MTREGKRDELAPRRKLYPVQTLTFRSLPEPGFFALVPAFLIFPLSLSAAGVAPPGTEAQIRVSAELLVANESKSEAQRQLQDALSSAETPEAKACVYAERGHLLYLAGKKDLAAVDFEEALKIDADSRPATTYRARLWLDAKDYDRVIAVLKAQDDKMTNGDEQAILSLALLRRGKGDDLDRAKEVGSVSWDLGYKDPTFDVEVAMAEYCLAFVPGGAALEHFQNAAKFAPHHPDVAAQMEQLREEEREIEAGNFDAAKKAFHAKDYKSAAEECEGVLSRHPKDAEGQILLGKIYLAWADAQAEKGDVTDARRTLELARKSNDGEITKQVDMRVSSLLDHMRSAHAEKREDLALAIAEAQLAVVPDDLSARLVQIAVYANSERWAMLIKAYIDGLQHMPETPLAAVYRQQWAMGQAVISEQAVSAMEKKVSSGADPTDQIDELISVFDDISRSSYATSAKLECLARLHMLRGNWNETRYAMRKALALAEPDEKPMVDQRLKQYDSIIERAPAKGPNVAYFIHFREKIDALIAQFQAGNSRVHDRELETKLSATLVARIEDLRTEFALLHRYRQQAAEEQENFDRNYALAEQAMKTDEEAYRVAFRAADVSRHAVNVTNQYLQDAESRIRTRLQTFWRD